MPAPNNYECTLEQRIQLHADGVGSLSVAREQTFGRNETAAQACQPLPEVPILRGAEGGIETAASLHRCRAGEGRMNREGASDCRYREGIREIRCPVRLAFRPVDHFLPAAIVDVTARDGAGVVGQERKVLRNETVIGIEKQEP